MEAAQLLQLTNASQSTDHSIQSKPTESNSQQEFLVHLMDAKPHNSQSQQELNKLQKLLDKHGIEVSDEELQRSNKLGGSNRKGSSEKMLQIISGLQGIDIPVQQTNDGNEVDNEFLSQLEEIISQQGSDKSEGVNLELSKEEVDKLQQILSEAGYNLSDGELIKLLQQDDNLKIMQQLQKYKVENDKQENILIQLAELFSQNSTGKVQDEISNSGLSKDELNKLQQLLTKNGFEISSQELKKLLQENDNAEVIKKLTEYKTEQNGAEGNILAQLAEVDLQQTSNKDSDDKQIINLELNEQEIKKLKLILNGEETNISKQEIHNLLESLSNIQQQLKSINTNQLSFDSSGQKEEFAVMKDRLLKLVKEFSSEIKDLKKIKLEDLEKRIKAGDNLSQPTKQAKEQEFKQLQKSLIDKLAKLKKTASNLQQQKPLSNQKQNQQTEQIIKLVSNLDSLDQKLSKLLEKYGISKDQIKFGKQNNTKPQFSGQNSNAIKEDTAKEANNQKQQSANDGKNQSRQQLKDNKTSLEKQLSNSQNKNEKSSETKQQIKTKLAAARQRLEADKSKETKVSIDEQIKAKSNITSQQVTKQLISINGKTRHVNQASTINQIMQQLEQLRSAGKNELTMKLEPEFLGKLKLKMSIDKGVMTAKIVAENYQVKKMIESQLPHLKNSLAQKDVEVGEMIVDVGSGDDFGASQEQDSFNQGGFSGQQGEDQGFDGEVLDLEEITEATTESPLNVEQDSIDYVI